MSDCGILCDTVESAIKQKQHYLPDLNSNDMSLVKDSAMVATESQPSSSHEKRSYFQVRDQEDDQKPIVYGTGKSSKINVDLLRHSENIASKSESPSFANRMRLEECYVISEAQLGNRQILGHINPITLKFIPVTSQNGSSLFPDHIMDAYLKQKVLFAFIEEDNLEKMLILSTLSEDVKKYSSNAENRLILGEIDRKTYRFVPNIFPGPGFYDWESFFQNKRGIYGNVDPDSSEFEPFFIESENDYELAHELNKMMGVLGHIDTISRKFVAKKKPCSGENDGCSTRIKVGSSKMKNVVVCFIDEKFPGMEIVVNPHYMEMDYELSQKVKSSIQIRGKIDPFHRFFKPSRSQNMAEIYPNERLLKKNCIIGHINPYSQVFIPVSGSKKRTHSEIQFGFSQDMICRKVVIAHIDQKQPHIGYVINTSIMDKEVSDKLIKTRGILGHVDVSTRKFVPDVSAIRDDTSLLRKLIKKRAILGYIDPVNLTFVKEEAPWS